MSKHWKIVIFDEQEILAEVRLEKGCPGDRGTTAPTRDSWEITGKFITHEGEDISSAIGSIDNAFNGNIFRNFSEQING